MLLDIMNSSQCYVLWTIEIQLSDHLTYLSMLHYYYKSRNEDENYTFAFPFVTQGMSYLM